MFLLHLPDFLGFEIAISMAADHGALVKRSLRIKKAGNDWSRCWAGSQCIRWACAWAGFIAPGPAAALRLARELRVCLDEMSEITLLLADKITFPVLERDYEFISLCPDDEYPMNLGRIRSNKGLDVDQNEFGRAIDERQVEHSTRSHAVVKDRGPYLVGPLARLNLNSNKLTPRAAELLPKLCKAVGKSLPWRNNFYSLLARGLETVHSLELAAGLLVDIRPASPLAGADCSPGRRRRHGTEAPRGICWHEYRTEADGTIASARIVPPTTQNYATIEADLRALKPPPTPPPSFVPRYCRRLTKSGCMIWEVFSRASFTPFYAVGGRTV